MFFCAKNSSAFEGKPAIKMNVRRECASMADVPVRNEKTRLLLPGLLSQYMRSARVNFSSFSKDSEFSVSPLPPLSALRLLVW